MRAYVITGLQGNHSRVIALKSSKQLAIKACENEVGTGNWSTKEKHAGEYKGEYVSATYEMFYVNA